MLLLSNPPTPTTTTTNQPAQPNLTFPLVLAQIFLALGFGLGGTSYLLRHASPAGSIEYIFWSKHGETGGHDTRGFNSVGWAGLFADLVGWSVGRSGGRLVVRAQ